MKIFSFLFIALLCVFLPDLSFASNTIDSVLSSISNKSKNEQVSITADLCWENRSKNPSTALKYGKFALHISEKHPVDYSKAKIYNYIGVVYSNLGILDSSYSYYQRAFIKASEIKDTAQLAYSLNNLGDYFLQSALYSAALEKFYESNNLFLKLDDKTGEAYSYNDIGLVYFYQKDYKKALDFFTKAADIRFKLKDFRGYSRSLSDIAETYAITKNYKKALETYDESEKYGKISGYAKVVFYIYDGKSKIHLAQGDYKKALDYSKKALTIATNIENKVARLISYNNLGYIYIKLNDFDSAITYLTLSRDEAKASGILTELMQSYRYLALIAVNQGDYKLAYDYSTESDAIRDSIFSHQDFNRIADLQSAFLIQQKEKENELLKKDIELWKYRRNFLIVIAILILLFIILYVSKYYTIKRTNKLLNDENNAKNKLFSIIAHDLNNPVGAITSISEFLRTDYNDIIESDRKELVNSIADASKNIQLMLSNLLSWARSQREGIKINKISLNVSGLLIGIASNYKFLAKKKDIELIVDCPSDLTIDGDKFVIETILGNLITNAIKFSNSGSQVILIAKEYGNKAIIEVKDFGKGMNNESIELILRSNKSFTTEGTNKEKGIGLGLQICKELVALHQVEMDITSEPQKGTTFILRF